MGLNTKLIYFVKSILFLGFSILFLNACGLNTPAVSDLSSSSKNTGAPDTSNLLQIKVTDSNGSLFKDPSVPLTVGTKLTLKAALFNLSGDFVKEESVFWSIKTLSGGLNSGLSCIAIPSTTCDFTPLQAGVVILEASYIGTDKTVIGLNASSPPIMVTSLSVPSTMTIQSGDNQLVVANSDSTSPLAVIAKDSFGQPVTGVTVSFTVTAGGGSVNSATAITDTNGIARSIFHSSTLAGSLNNTIVAQVVANPALIQTLHASTIAGGADHLSYLVQPAGSYSLVALNSQPVVQLRDLYDNVVSSNANVVLTRQAGTGALGGTTTLPMINGTASFSNVTYSVAETGIVLRATSGALGVNSVPFIVATSGGAVDRDPDDVIFKFSVSYVGGAPGRTSSNSVTIAGIAVPIDITLSGAGNPKLILNGGAEVASLTGVGVGAQIAVAVDAPTILGNKNTVTVYMGTRIETWELGYADSTKIAPVFVTSTNYAGNFGGVSSADTACQTVATNAGLGGNWMAMVATATSASVRTRIPWNYGQVRRLDGVIVANDFNDLWDGVWAFPINVTENQAVKNSDVWWGNTIFGEGYVGAPSADCGTWTSNSGGATSTVMASASTTLAVNNSKACSSTLAFFCMGDTSGAADTDPTDVDFLADVSYVASARKVSNIITITGITASIPVSIAGSSGTPQIKINGGAEVSSGTASLGDTIQLVMDAPSSLGTKNTATVTMGSDVRTWWVGYADNTKTARVFVSDYKYPGGSFGGSSGMDSRCQTMAGNAGYAGTWKALIGDSSNGGGPRNRMNYNWGNLLRIDGAVVATSWSDLWDGSIANSISVDEFANTQNGSAWTGSTSQGALDVNGIGTCSNWSVRSAFARGGSTASTSSTWINNASLDCNDGGGYYFYCVEDVPAVDTLPTALNFPVEVSYVSGVGGRTGSVTQTIRGISQAVSVSISATGGNATFKINGGAEVTSGTVQWGDTVKIFMDSPTVFGTKYTATLTVGSGVYTWSLGYADSSITARIFVADTALAPSSLGGLSGADSKCQAMATTASYSGTWKALLATTTFGGPRNRMNFNWGTLKRIDGAVVATSWSDLWDGTIANSINRDENGNLISTGWVITGSDALGNLDSTSGITTCNDWSTNNSSVVYRMGSVGSTSGTWLFNAMSYCDASIYAYYYCYEDTVVADTDPGNLYFPMEVSNTAGVPGRKTSSTVSIKGINQAVSVTVSGASGNPAIKINGGAEVASGTVNWGDTVQVVMDAPSVFGTKYTATINIGSGSYTWNLAYADSTITAKVFVTSGLYTGNLNGSGGPNGICQTTATAAGYSGTWKAIFSTSSSKIRETAPFNWGTLARVDGVAAATNWSDLWDGSLTNPITKDENGASTTGYAWTGSASNGSATALNCNDWGSSSSAILGRYGQITSNSNWISFSDYDCVNYASHLYCIEDTVSNDLTPYNFFVPYKLYQNTSTRISSVAVPVTGITAAAAVTISGASGNPAFKINGGAEVTSGNVNNGDTITLVMDSPGTFNQSNKMTVQIGNGAATPWRVWTGDGSSGIQKRIFVTSTTYLGNIGGIAAVDALCQARGNSNAGLAGKTWKALVSGPSTSEVDWAINHIGYNWAELWTINPDGSLRNKVLNGSQIWNTPISLVNTVNYTEAGAVATATTMAWTGTNQYGFGNSTSACNTWTFGSYQQTSTRGNRASPGDNWVNDSAAGCDNPSILYCIEQ